MKVTTAPMRRLLNRDRPNVLFVVSKAYVKFDKVLCVKNGVVSKV